MATQETALTNQLPGFSANTSPAAEQVEAWKSQHGKIKVFEVGGHTFVFKQPGRELVKVANAELVKTKSADRYADVLITNCLLNGQDVVKADDEIYFALQGVVDKLITSYTAELKN